MFSSVIAMQNIIFKKIPTLTIKCYFHFADRPTDPIFFVALPIDQKIKLVLPYQKIA